MGARYPYYIVADSPEGLQKEAAITRTPPKDRSVRGDIRHGFVYERVPHITLKSIANNAEIDVIWETWQQTLKPLLDATFLLLRNNLMAHRVEATLEVMEVGGVRTRTVVRHFDRKIEAPNWSRPSSPMSRSKSAVARRRRASPSVSSGRIPSVPSTTRRRIPEWSCGPGAPAVASRL